MADLRIPRQPPVPALTTPVRPAVRAAQQAFFQAAAGAQPPPAAPARAQPVADALRPSEPVAGRPLRPGSLLDIKV